MLAVCLDLVSVQIEKTSVQVASGSDATFTLQTISDTSLIRWTTAGGTTLAMWANGQPFVISVPEYQGRISVTATQLKITNSQLRDSGNYTVSVEPSPSTGLGISTRSVQLKVFGETRYAYIYFYLNYSLNRFFLYSNFQSLRNMFKHI